MLQVRSGSNFSCSKNPPYERRYLVFCRRWSTFDILRCFCWVCRYLIAFLSVEIYISFPAAHSVNIKNGQNRSQLPLDGQVVADNTEKKENVGFSDEALKKCLEERNGENSAMVTCNSILEAFNKSSTSSSSTKKPLTPLRLRSGSFTDV
ncbi:hypothetical protein Pfo_001208 [Paulownia fortunei]|nr:hypothetical protein Pfo_001208 [Paulownia fortunei]